jgi:UDP:flavonoid glycosyltransferase YjiC (YdhE family)
VRVKVVIMAFGSRGDVAPFIGLGVRLKAAGHDVAVATQELFAAEIRACGLEFRAFPGDIRTTLESEHGQAWRESSGMRAWQARLQVAMEIQPDIAEGVTAAAPGADILLLHYVAFAHGYLMARAMGIPCMALEIFPSLPTAKFLPAYFGSLATLGPWGNRILPRFAMRARTPLDAGIADFQRRLGLPATGLPAINRALVEDDRLPVFHGFSPTIVPRPPDWRPGAEVVGYWWPERPAGWEPPRALVDFLAAGPPPVYVGFGSMAGGDGDRLSGVVSEALRRVGVRAVVGAGWADLSAAGDDTFVVGDVPHDWLFPRMAAVVHHAGAGTTGATLRAGVPVVSTPVLADQPFWAHRLVRMGVSPGSVPLRRLSAKRLAALIRQATTEPAYRRRARAVAERVRLEDGAGRVAEALARTPAGTV